jgi:geranylgeranyl reductase family protein
MTFDVIVVGAGPGGSSAACWLARQGIATLLLDKSDFPRDKVCGDGLTPQAISWLDQLGCVDEVLAETDACLKDCDLFINGEHVLTGGFAKGSIYPDFAVLLDRRRFDHILLRHAIAQGARFEGKTLVRGIEIEPDCARVLAESGRQSIEYRGRIVIGADGVNSSVSRAIGNTLKEGVVAVSLRTYYKNVTCPGSQIKVYFDRAYFPGYGWIFVDDHGSANVGLGYAFDRNFPLLDNLGEHFRTFIETELGAMLKSATRCGPVSGGSAAFYRPRSIVADRVLLIGDAANQADPLNGGGIHKAMEGAFCASEACRDALAAGDFSRAGLARYESLWSERFDLDWRTAEIFLSIAKNPNLKDFCLFLLKQIGRLTAADPEFQEFASGVFSGVISQSACLSPRALYHAFPKNPRAWLSLLESNGGWALGPLHLARGAFASLAGAGVQMSRSPLRNLHWGLEVATKLLQLAERRVARAPGGDLS